MLSKLFLSGACYWYLNWTVGEPLPEKAVAVGVEVYQVNQTAILDYTYVARGPAIDSEEIFMIHQQKAYVSSIHREVNATHDTFVYEKYLTHPPDTEAPILACDTSSDHLQWTEYKIGATEPVKCFHIGLSRVSRQPILLARVLKESAHGQMAWHPAMFVTDIGFAISYFDKFRVYNKFEVLCRK